MFLEFTCPIIVNGKHCQDTDCAIDVRVTYRGKPNTRHSPAESPEFDISAYFVGYSEKNQVGKYVHGHVPADAEHIKRIDDYLATSEGAAYIYSSIDEELEAV